MEIKNVVIEALKEIVVPEISSLSSRLDKLEAHYSSVTKRLDDLNSHLIDQSRRIDELRRELVENNEKMRSELRTEFHTRFGEHEIKLQHYQGEIAKRLDLMNGRLDRIIQDKIDRPEHTKLEVAQRKLEEAINEIAKELALLKEKVK